MVKLNARIHEPYFYNPKMSGELCAIKLILIAILQNHFLSFTTVIAKKIYPDNLIQLMAVLLVPNLQYLVVMHVYLSEPFFSIFVVCP